MASIAASSDCAAAFEFWAFECSSGEPVAGVGCAVPLVPAAPLAAGFAPGFAVAVGFAGLDVLLVAAAGGIDPVPAAEPVEPAPAAVAEAGLAGAAELGVFSGL